MPEEHTPVYKKAELIGICFIALVTAVLLFSGIVLDALYYGFMGSLVIALCGGKIVAKRFANGSPPKA